ncbi:hypothetical protein PMZ80_006299 [Knufia obscura]|uniref:Uncharacterized protein n=2 Tax=Knufia TaxID=430999 RepID=A0AAN8IMU1_9EURO|nr:hypothetical protein PMZ80_006299 [Knufia obscura]KAK5953557.1 hypothetical protein OHC33_005501 [Knufia fluminis]
MPRGSNPTHIAAHTLPTYLIFLSLLLTATTVRAIDHHRKTSRRTYEAQEHQFQSQPYTRRSRGEGRSRDSHRSKRGKDGSRRGEEGRGYREYRDYDHDYQSRYRYEHQPYVYEGWYDGPPPPYQPGQLYDDIQPQSRLGVQPGRHQLRPQLRDVDDQREDWSDDASTLVDGHGHGQGNGHRGRERHRW